MMSPMKYIGICVGILCGIGMYFLVRHDSPILIQNKTCFSRGDSVTVLLLIQGQPTAVETFAETGERWIYKGGDSVWVHDNKVVGFRNYQHSLKVKW